MTQQAVAGGVKLVCGLVMAATATIARGQAPATSDPAVTPASIVAAPAAEGAAVMAPRLRFGQRPTAPGDRVAQRLGVELVLDAKIVQSGQVASEAKNVLRRQQQRRIEVLEAVDGRAVKARATFQYSRRQSPESENPDELSVQPIEGKTYLMTRTGDALQVTDAEGNVPPLDEYKLVMESLDNVGKPNPLIVLLDGRTLAVGEHIFVPREMARTLLGLGPELGTVHRFELTLAREATDPRIADVPLAVFSANIEIRPNEASPLTITLGGELMIEPTTCRLYSADLAGPVQMSSIERTEGGIYQFTAAGQLQIAMRSAYAQSE